VACAPEAVEQVLAIFRAEGFADATVIGDVLEDSTGVSVI
jgi:selenide,water dikinase